MNKRSARPCPLCGGVAGRSSFPFATRFNAVTFAYRRCRVLWRRFRRSGSRRRDLHEDVREERLSRHPLRRVREPAGFSRVRGAAQDIPASRCERAGLWLRARPISPGVGSPGNSARPESSSTGRRREGGGQGFGSPRLRLGGACGQAGHGGTSTLFISAMCSSISPTPPRRSTRSSSLVKPGGLALRRGASREQPQSGLLVRADIWRREAPLQAQAPGLGRAYASPASRRCPAACFLRALLAAARDAPLERLRDWLALQGRRRRQERHRCSCDHARRQEPIWRDLRQSISHRASPAAQAELN